VNKMRQMQAGITGMGSAPSTAGPSAPSTEALDERCGICHEEQISDPYTIPQCGHSFCMGCLGTWQSYLKKQHSMMPGSGGGADENDAPALTCPTCRANTPDIGMSINETAMLYAQRANRDGLSEDERTEYRELALAELKKFDGPSFLHDVKERVQKLATSSSILRELGRPADALKCLEEMEEIDRAALESKREVSRLLHALDLAESAGRNDEADAIAERLEAMKETNRKRLEWFELYLSMAETKEDMKDWAGAMELYKWKVMMKMHRTEQEIEDDEDGFTFSPSGANTPSGATPSQERRMIMGMSRCLYHLEKYDTAIELGESAITMNRHFPQVHKHVALSQKAKGDYAAALTTMARAVQYETPWDEANKKVVLKMYEEMKKDLEAKPLICDSD